MGQGESKSCREHANNSLPACPHEKNIDWIQQVKGLNPCSTVDTFISSPLVCLDDKCPLYYTRTDDCICTKDPIMTVDALQGFNFSDTHIADCCDGTAPRHTCPSNYCRASGAAGAGPGCAKFMEKYCQSKSTMYPRNASGEKISIDWDSIDYTSDPKQFIFLWQHYPRCACYDEDGQKFDAKRRHVIFNDGNQTQFVSMDMTKNPPNCWFKHCKSPYIYGQKSVCNTAITVCAQFSDITIQGDSNMSPITLSNECTANAEAIVAEEQTSTTNIQDEERKTEDDKSLQNNNDIIIFSIGGVSSLLITCCCIIVILLASRVNIRKGRTKVHPA